MTISDRLREWRAFKNLTQKDAAALLGMSHAVYQKYELKSGDNSRKPGAEAIEALVKGGVNANWILTGIGPMLIADYSTAQSPAQVAAAEPPPCPVDVTRLTEAIDGIETLLTNTDRTMRPAAKARAITLVYQILEDENKEKDSASYEYAQRMIKKLVLTMA